MIVGRLTMSFDRGTQCNQAEDVGLPVTPNTTPSGGEIRGLGTHFRSPEAKEFATRCQIEEGRINRAMTRQFMRSPIPGLYVLPDRRAGERFLNEIVPSSEVNARCVVYDLTPGEDLPEAELAEWVKRIQNQIATAPLGRAQGASAEGLSVIERLIECPVLAESTRNELTSLVAQAKIETINRVEFKRKIAKVQLKLDTTLEERTVAPRRAPVSMEGAPAPVPVA